MLARKVKLKLNKKQREKIKKLSLVSSILFNKLLQHNTDLLDSGSSILTHFDMINYCKVNKLNEGIGTDISQEICKRLFKSLKQWQESERIKLKFWLEYGNKYSVPLKNYLKKTKKKLWGKPRFKKKDISIQFPVRIREAKNIKVSEKQTSVKVPLVGDLKGRNDRQEIIGNVKQVSINIDSCKDVWATIICDGSKPKAEIPSRNNAIGVDLGLKHTVTAANEFEIIQPERERFLDKQIENIKKASRKKKRDLPFLYRKITRRRKHSHHVMAKKLIEAANEIYIGNLSSKFLFQGKLARSASDAAHHQFLQILSYKAENAGKIVTKIDEYYTSQTCYRCKRKQKMELWERVYICNCGYSCNRDVNSALNILRIGEKLRL